MPANIGLLSVVVFCRVNIVCLAHDSSYFVSMCVCLLEFVLISRPLLAYVYVCIRLSYFRFSWQAGLLLANIYGLRFRFPISFYHYPAS